MSNEFSLQFHHEHVSRCNVALVALVAVHRGQEQDESERTEDEEGRKRTEKDKEGRKEEDAEKRADKLRALIRQGESISDDILDLIKEIDEKEEKLNTARAVLNAKDLEDGKNLLLYAAAHGQVDSLTCLVRNMSEVRIRVTYCRSPLV